MWSTNKNFKKYSPLNKKKKEYSLYLLKNQNLSISKILFFIETMIANIQHTIVFLLMHCNKLYSGNFKYGYQSVLRNILLKKSKTIYK